MQSGNFGDHNIVYPGHPSLGLGQGYYPMSNGQFVGHQFGQASPQPVQLNYYPEYHGIDWIPSYLEKKQLENWFSALDTSRTGLIGGPFVVEFLKSCGLTKEILRVIWALVDTSGSGLVNMIQFFRIVRLIEIALSPVYHKRELSLELYGSSVHVSLQLPSFCLPASLPQPVKSVIVDEEFSDFAEAKITQSSENTSYISGNTPGMSSGLSYTTTNEVMKPVEVAPISPSSNLADKMSCFDDLVESVLEEAKSRAEQEEWNDFESPSFTGYDNHTENPPNTKSDNLVEEIWDNFQSSNELESRGAFDEENLSSSLASDTNSQPDIFIECLSDSIPTVEHVPSLDCDESDASDVEDIGEFVFSQYSMENNEVKNIIDDSLPSSVSEDSTFGKEVTTEKLPTNSISESFNDNNILCAVPDCSNNNKALDEDSNEFSNDNSSFGHPSEVIPSTPGDSLPKADIPSAIEESVDDPFADLINDIELPLLNVIENESSEIFNSDLSSPQISPSDSVSLTSMGISIIKGMETQDIVDTVDDFGDFESHGISSEGASAVLPELRICAEEEQDMQSKDLDFGDFESHDICTETTSSVLPAMSTNAQIKQEIQSNDLDFGDFESHDICTETTSSILPAMSTNAQIEQDIQSNDLDFGDFESHAHDASIVPVAEMSSDRKIVLSDLLDFNEQPVIALNTEESSGHYLHQMESGIKDPSFPLTHFQPNPDVIEIAPSSIKTTEFAPSIENIWNGIQSQETPVVDVDFGGFEEHSMHSLSQNIASESFDPFVNSMDQEIVFSIDSTSSSVFDQSLPSLSKITEKHFIDFPILRSPLFTSATLGLPKLDVKSGFTYEELSLVWPILVQKGFYVDSLKCLDQLEFLYQLRNLAEKKKLAVENDDLELAIEIKKSINLVQNKLYSTEMEKKWISLLQSSDCRNLKALVEKLSCASDVFDKMISSLFASSFDTVENALRNGISSVISTPNAIKDLENELLLLCDHQRRISTLEVFCENHTIYLGYWNVMMDGIMSILSTAEIHFSEFFTLLPEDKQQVSLSSKLQDYCRGLLEITQVGLSLYLSCCECFVLESKASDILHKCKYIQAQLAALYPDIWKTSDSRLYDLNYLNKVGEHLFSLRHSVDQLCSITLRPIDSVNKDIPYENKDSVFYLKSSLRLFLHLLPDESPPRPVISSSL